MKHVEIYTDGACKGNPGAGGWGALLIYRKNQKELYGGKPSTTNNEMELTAVLEGVSLLKEPCKVTIYTDSNYVINCLSKWYAGWEKSNFVTSTKKPVKNKELIQKVHAALQQHKVKWVWVKGHSGNLGNERADALANKGIEYGT